MTDEWATMLEWVLGEGMGYFHQLYFWEDGSGMEQGSLQPPKQKWYGMRWNMQGRYEKRNKWCDFSGSLSAVHLSGSNRWWTWQNSPGGAVSFTDVPIIPPTSASLSEGSAQLSPSVSNHRLSPFCPFGFVSCRTDISPENTLWVGAWWIGFLGAGAASLLISIPILGYPQRLPGRQPVGWGCVCTFL